MLSRDNNVKLGDNAKWRRLASSIPIVALLLVGGMVVGALEPVETGVLGESVVATSAPVMALMEEVCHWGWDLRCKSFYHSWLDYSVCLQIVIPMPCGSTCCYAFHYDDHGFQATETKNKPLINSICKLFLPQCLIVTTEK